MSARSSDAARTLAVLGSAMLMPKALSGEIRAAAGAVAGLEIVADLNEALLQRGVQSIVAVICDPATALGSALQAGTAPVAAVTAYREAAQHLLAELDRSRRKPSLVIIDTLGTPAVHSLDPALAEPLQAAARQAWVSPSMKLAAAALLQADPAVRKATETLYRRAGLDDVTRAASLIEAVGAMQHPGTSGDPADLRERLIQSEARLGLCLETIQRFKEILGTQLADVTQLVEANARLEDSVAQVRADLAEQTLLASQIEPLRQSLRDMQSRAALREAVLGARLIDDTVLHNSQTGLIRRYEDWSQDMQADIERMKQELDKVYGSRSWRVTAPLRSLRRKPEPDVAR